MGVAGTFAVPLATSHPFSTGVGGSSNSLDSYDSAVEDAQNPRPKPDNALTPTQATSAPATPTHVPTSAPTNPPPTHATSAPTNLAPTHATSAPANLAPTPATSAPANLAPTHATSAGPKTPSKPKTKSPSKSPPASESPPSSTPCRKTKKASTKSPSYWQCVDSMGTRTYAVHVCYISYCMMPLSSLHE